MASDELTFGKYSSPPPPPFFFVSTLSRNASSELLVLASVSQFDSSHPLIINGKSCQDLLLPTLNSISLLTVKQRHKDYTLLRLMIDTKLSEVYTSRVYLHFPTCLNLLKKKKIYCSLLQDTAPGIPLDIVFTLYK